MKKRIFALFLCLISLLTLFPVSAFADTPLPEDPTLPEITGQPESVCAAPDTEIAVTVTATGDGLTYLWYFSDAGAEFQASDCAESTYTAVMSEELDGRELYCLITDANGNTVQSETVTLELSKPKIIRQPESTGANVGKKVSVTVEATGQGLKYQWYFCNADKTKFSKSSVTSKTYTTTMSESRDGRKIYCLITDENGYSVKSDTVTISITRPKITRQPQDASAYLGKKVSTTVEATGAGLKYQWYLKNPGQSKFSKSSITTKTYSTKITEDNDGRKVYCVITNKYGYSVKTETVTLSLNKPKITRQPESCYVEIGEKASTSVEATGQALKYQWYFCDAGKTKFSKASITTATYAVPMTTARNGRRIYCVITDKYGASVKTKTVTLKVPEYAKITKQPKGTTITIGSTGSVSLSASGDGLTYQWYLSDDGGETFGKSSVTKAVYSLKMTAAKSGRLLYCVVTDRYGTSVQSDTVKLMARNSFKLNQYSLKVGASKNLAKELKYDIDDTIQWKSSKSSVVSVTEDGVITRHKKGTVTITATGVNTGIVASCTVKVPGTKQVALTFDDGPSTHTARFLDYLATTDAKVTFFMVGNRMNSYKDTVKRMAKQGHELGYHSWDHYNQTKRSSSQITSEFNKANKILKNLTGQEFTVWRTPGGAFNDRVLKCVPLPHIFWTSSTQDWRTRNATKVYNAILDQAKDGAIILLHDLHGTTVDGAIRAMKVLEKQGYEFVTVTEILSRNGEAPKASVNYYKG